MDDQLGHLSELVGRYDFAKVVNAYWKGHVRDNERLNSDAMHGLRGEFTTKTGARNALGVLTMVDDACVYDHFKLLSLFIRQAKYKRLLFGSDELHK